MKRLSLIAACLAVPALAAPKFSLTSTDVKPNSTLANKHVFDGMGCTGENLSPHLAWSGAPEGTKSFVVTVFDPDAPTGSGWWHWVVYDIPADTTSLATGADSGKAELPKGAIQGRTDFGKAEFGGACPPTGDKPHRYVFTVYALKVEKLEVPADASPAMIGFMTNANKLASATFAARFGRK